MLFNQIEPSLGEVIIVSYDGGFGADNGSYEGSGTAVVDNGCKYEGQFRNGMFHGKGVFTWPRGVKFEGDFEAGQILGKGSYEWSDGSIYVGDVRCGLRHGSGKFTGSSGQVYEGEWADGKRHGKGKFWYNEDPTVVYTGDWTYDFRQGYGNLKYGSGMFSNTIDGSASSKLLRVVMDSWQPNVCDQHINPITCLEVHFGKNLLVTAEDKGKSSKVVIWDLTTFVVLLTISDSHGVKSMDISEDGELLLVVSADPTSIVTLYRIATGAVLYGPIDMKDYIFAVRFTGQAYTFALCSQLRCVSYFVEDEEEECDDDLKFYNLEKGDYGLVGEPATGVPATAVCQFVGAGTVVAGTEKGQLLVWHGLTATQLIEAHRVPVTALDFNCTSLTLISGAGDGGINVYQAVGYELTLMRSFDMSCHESLRSHSIAALSLSPNGRRALVTTTAAEVMEIALVDTSPDISAGDPTHSSLITCSGSICSLEPSCTASIDGDDGGDEEDDEDATNEGRNDPPEETVTPLMQRTVNYANILSPEPQTMSEEGVVVLAATPTVAHGQPVSSRGAGEENIPHLQPSNAAYLCQTGEQADHLIQQLELFNSKMLIDSALPGSGQCRMYSPHEKVVLVNCPLCEARGRSIYLEARNGSFEFIQEHVDLHYMPQKVYLRKNPAPWRCSPVEMITNTDTISEMNGIMGNYDAEEGAVRHVHFRLDLNTYADAPWSDVGDWWNLGRGLDASADIIKKENNDLAFKLNIDLETFYEFAAWNEANFPIVSPPPLPVTSSYDNASCWMEAAALCNFGIYAGDMRLRLRMFKSAFSGQLQMEDKFGNLYSRAIAAANNTSLFHQFDAQVKLAEKRGVDVWSVLRDIYAKSLVKAIRTNYTMARGTTGSAANWLPVTVSNMLSAKTTLQHFLLKQHPVHAARAQTEENDGTAADENLPPRHNAVNVVDEGVTDSLKQLYVSAQDSTVSSEVMRGEEDVVMVKQLDERMGKFALHYANKNNVAYRDTKIFRYQAVVKEFGVPTSANSLKVMMFRVENGTAKRNVVVTLSNLNSLLNELGF